ncbi:MAG: hypothetical protein V7K55_22280 [Nostoc sp.]|uniref:hypothetical protein n=1 Tax=Nostoc sp. TaxID=1180 RepID=UPI002FF4FC7B
MTSDSEARWNFVPIDKKHQKDSFDCGYAILNDYLNKYARQNNNKGIAKTFVAIPTSGSLKIDGYYTVSASIIEYESLPESYHRYWGMCDRSPDLSTTLTCLFCLISQQYVPFIHLKLQNLMNTLYNLLNKIYCITNH